MLRIGLLIGFVAILLFSCSTPDEQQEAVFYFDIEQYISDLSEASLVIDRVEKTVALNEAEETLTITSYDLSPELEMMKKYNINKASLAGKYQVVEKGEFTIYSAIERDLLTQKLTIRKQGEEVSMIEIEGYQNSILSESKQKIVFKPSESFQLVSDDDNKYNNDLVKEILITF